MSCGSLGGMRGIRTRYAQFHRKYKLIVSVPRIARITRGAVAHLIGCDEVSQ